MSRSVQHIVLLSLLLPPRGTAQTADGRFKFVATDSVAASRSERQIGDCGNTPAFAALLADLTSSDPLQVHSAAVLQGVLFGSAFDPKSDAPLFRLDLDDLEMLPTAAQTRTWQSDSSWALTRCEILAHELAEAVEYRRLWRQHSDTVNDHFKARIAAAHAEGLRREGLIAAAQWTRADSTGRPYMRTGFCNLPEARKVRVVLGANTETLVLGENGIKRIEYAPRADLCVEEHL